jgi:hypothetical protein
MRSQKYWKGQFRDMDILLDLEETIIRFREYAESLIPASKSKRIGNVQSILDQADQIKATIRQIKQGRGVKRDEHANKPL